ncbi:signal peptidase II [Zoogloea sp.]|uniref:signal peptidase II n=1 Tax=Zoogloea sp. TaxID=49181 RepID=UPI002628C3F6|nr:signal peptidase II [Zoogloea sp.]MDD3353617.1 signal peptidase II [Zoogloea sp.]
MKLRLGNWIGLSALIVLVDQWTKHLVLGALRHGEVIRVTDFFDIVLAFNPGAAFSFLADQGGWQRWFFVGLAVIICSWLLRLLARHQHELLQPLAFSLIIGGAIGNVIDRFVFGAVVDFLYFHVGRYGWPAFNVADSAICVGVTLMVIAQFRETRHAATQEKLS